MPGSVPAPPTCSPAEQQLSTAALQQLLAAQQAQAAQQAPQQQQLELHKQETRVLLGMLWAFATGLREARRVEAVHHLLAQL